MDDLLERLKAISLLISWGKDKKGEGVWDYINRETMEEAFNRLEKILSKYLERGSKEPSSLKERFDYYSEKIVKILKDGIPELREVLPEEIYKIVLTLAIDYYAKKIANLLLDLVEETARFRASNLKVPREIISVMEEYSKKLERFEEKCSQELYS